jgi:hypothetical protein
MAGKFGTSGMGHSTPPLYVKDVLDISLIEIALKKINQQ